MVTVNHFDGSTSEVEVSKLIWRPSAYGIVIKDSKVLLVRQKNGYDLPGGGLELGELPMEAVLREIKEESGIIAANPKLIAVESSYYKAHGIAETYHQSIMMYYTCDFVSGELSADGFDEWEQQFAEAPEWLPLEKLDSIAIGTSVDYRKYIKQIRS